MANNSITPATQPSTVARKICPECKEEVMNVAYCRRYDPEKKKPVQVKVGHYCFGCGHFIAEES